MLQKIVRGKNDDCKNRKNTEKKSETRKIEGQKLNKAKKKLGSTLCPNYQNVGASFPCGRLGKHLSRETTFVIMAPSDVLPSSLPTFTER